MRAVNTGIISATESDAVLFTFGQFINTGTVVSADANAFEATSVSDVTVRNSGLMSGNVKLGDTNDVYRGQHGIVEGEVLGGSGHDSLVGGQAVDVFRGEAGSDTLNGRGDDDWLDGGEGTDRLYGKRGDDTLIGGLGQDDFHGGAGEDVFVFEAGSTGKSGDADVIHGFQRGADVVDLSGYEGIAFAGKRFSGDGDAEFKLRALRGDKVQVQIDEDGDGTVDAHIHVTGIANLSEADFLL